jgi:creatinine amidohydrolase
MTELEWWKLRAGEIRQLPRHTVVVVPVASTEQHGPHLPTETDCALVSEIARRAAARAAERCPVVVTPVIWTGLAEHHMSLGATLSLDYATFYALLRGICGSLVRHGFRKILLLNGHGGNVAALTVAVNELAVAFDAPIATATYWLLAQTAFSQILERQANVRHACEAETSMMLALAPDLVDLSLAADAVGPTETELVEVAGTDAAVRWRSFRSRTRHGAIGDPRAASVEKGERLFEAAAGAVADLVANTAFWTLPA